MLVIIVIINMFTRTFKNSSFIRNKFYLVSDDMVKYKTCVDCVKSTVTKYYSNKNYDMSEFNGVHNKLGDVLLCVKNKRPSLDKNVQFMGMMNNIYDVNNVYCSHHNDTNIVKLNDVVCATRHNLLTIYNNSDVCCVDYVIFDSNVITSDVQSLIDTYCPTKVSLKIIKYLRDIDVFGYSFHKLLLSTTWTFSVHKNDIVMTSHHHKIKISIDINNSICFMSIVNDDELFS